MRPRIGLVFPGQGSQSVGMGEQWADRFSVAAQAYEEADEILGVSISNLCWQGPESDLLLTANTQPALLATAVAIHRALGALELEPIAMAGHSLGEYAALVAAGSLDYGDALRLVRLRGEFMQEAVPVGEGAMAAILGPDAEMVEGVATSAAGDEVCAVANLNAPGQTVIAGHVGAVERAIEIAKKRGARRAMRLPVSAPFHSPLMAPARQNLTPYLEQTPFVVPLVPVVSNIDAKPVTTGSEVREALMRQIDGPVRWVESVIWMATEGGVELFVEVGPGKVLTGLIRRIVPDTPVISLAEPEGIEKLRERLNDTP